MLLSLEHIPPRWGHGAARGYLNQFFFFVLKTGSCHVVQLALNCDSQCHRCAWITWISCFLVDQLNTLISTIQFWGCAFCALINLLFDCKPFSKFTSESFMKRHPQSRPTPVLLPPPKEQFLADFSIFFLFSSLWQEPNNATRVLLLISSLSYTKWCALCILFLFF